MIHLNRISMFTQTIESEIDFIDCYRIIYFIFKFTPWPNQDAESEDTYKSRYSESNESIQSMNYEN